ncbi:MAG: flagellar hook-associated protein FlgK [Pseudomonadales bacterium]|nr:flagellar hook-associated protein FlgK [Pseudomonadales bacterium]
MAELTSIALSGLSAHKTALSTTGHNIANVDTEGYSRQQVTFSAYAPERMGGSYLGTGVSITNINRVTNDFLTAQLRRDTQNKESFSAYHEFAVRIDSLLGDDATAITPTLINFFNAVNDVADDPSSIPARQVLLSEGEALVNRFSSVYDQVFLQNEALNQDLTAVASEITELAAGISNLNEAIQVAGANSFNGAPNDLYDKRDEAVRRLSELIGINVVNEPNGSVNISVGTGQPLVVGSDSFSLVSQPDEAGIGRNDIVLDTGNNTLIVTDQVFGGRLGGLLQVREELIDPVFNQVGRMSMVISDTFNQQHQLGMDLSNRLGGLFFSDINTAGNEAARLSPNTTNTGNAAITVTVDDTTALTTDNYELRYDGTSGNYSLIELTNNTTVTSFAAPATMPDTVAVASQGITFNFNSGAPADGDTYMVTPTRLGASVMGLELNSPNQVAAALPVRSSVPLTNTGDGFVEEVRVTDTTTADFTTTASALTPPYRVIFTSTTAYEIHDMTVPASVPSAGTLVGTGTYIPNQSNNLLTDASVVPAPLATGYEVVFNGEPQTDDYIDLTYNNGAVNDNRNTLLLADLQRTKTMASGTATYQEAYNRIVGGVGTRTRDARIGEEAAETILRQTEAQRESVSGVNLDEEAADLIRFQNAYQASARIIQVSSELFDTILGVIA